MENKVCIEVIFEDELALDNLVINAKTDVLGGKIARFDWTGDVFNEVDMYRELFDGAQMSFLLNREDGKERAKVAIYKALKELIREIKKSEPMIDTYGF